MDRDDMLFEERCGVLAGLWRVAVSPVTFVVLSILWCLDLAAGSIHAYRLDPQFWVKMDSVPFNVWLRRTAPQVWPDSWWVYGLVALTYLVVLSLVLCTLNWFFRRRRRFRGVGEFLVHLGFLLVFAGFVLGSGFGTRSQGVAVLQGDTVPVPELGVHLRLDRVEVTRGPSGRPLDTVSRVALLRDGQVLHEGTLRTNHPLIWGSTVVYPQGSQSQIAGARLVLSPGGEVTVAPERPAPLADGGQLSVRGILNPGDRWGPYFGPGFVVARLGADGRLLANRFLSPLQRDAQDFAGIQVRLVDLQAAPLGVYNVHRDPGIMLVLVGAAILTLGTFWALFGYLGVRWLRAPPEEPAT